MSFLSFVELNETERYNEGIEWCGCHFCCYISRTPMVEGAKYISRRRKLTTTCYWWTNWMSLQKSLITKRMYCFIVSYHTFSGGGIEIKFLQWKGVDKIEKTQCFNTRNGIGWRLRLILHIFLRLILNLTIPSLENINKIFHSEFRNAIV